jgi:hypothetical protein
MIAPADTPIPPTTQSPLSSPSVDQKKYFSGYPQIKRIQRIKTLIYWLKDPACKLSHSIWNPILFILSICGSKNFFK